MSPTKASGGVTTEDFHDNDVLSAPADEYSDYVLGTSANANDDDDDGFVGDILPEAKAPADEYSDYVAERGTVELHSGGFAYSDPPSSPMAINESTIDSGSGLQVQDDDVPLSAPADEYSDYVLGPGDDNANDANEDTTVDDSSPGLQAPADEYSDYVDERLRRNA